MLFSLDHILVVLEHYKYILIFPIMIIEGPIITVISGFLAYLGFLNVFITYPLLVVGDLIGDCLYYGIGTYSGHYSWMRKTRTYLGYDEKSEAFLKNHFETHPTKTLWIAKISHGFGIPVQITAGISKMNLFKYVSIELIGTMVKTLILFVVGFCLGSSYAKIDGYFDIVAFVSTSIIILLLLWLILRKYIKNYFK